MRRRVPIVPLACLAWACGGGEQEPPQRLARPVTVFELSEREPALETLIPGVVVPYRQADIAFEVGGRVSRVEDVGEELLGAQVGRDGEPLLDEEGLAVRPGEFIAQIDSERYERAVKQAQLRLESSRLELRAQQLNLENVTEAQLESARARAEAAVLGVDSAKEDVAAANANVQLAQTTLDRSRELLPSGAVSDIAVKQAETELESALTRYEQARTLVTTREHERAVAEAAVAETKGNQLLLQAQIEALQAGVNELEEQLDDARRDLADCVLRAPFPGRITAVHVTEGSYVTPGTPVVTLTMMNPVKVEVTTSAVEDERLIVGSDATIFPTVGTEVDLGREMRATLYQKEGIADETTRTFRVGLIAPNEKRVGANHAPGIARVRYVLPILDNPIQLPGRGLFTIANAVYEDEQGTALFRVKGLSQGKRSSEALMQRLQAERVPVVLGDEAVRIASFTLVELLDCGDIDQDDLVVAFPEPAHLDGFVIDDERWLLRPGDLVRVALERGALPTGFYVPIQAIRERDGQTWIFVLDDQDRAYAQTVSVGETFRGLRRIDADGLQSGARIVSKGAHFLSDGDTVNVVSDLP